MAKQMSEVPTVSHKSREAGDELRDLYRKTLAAELTIRPGVPSADQVIEDIFSGGDGWCGNQPYESTTPTSGTGRKHIGGSGGTSADDSGNWSDDGGASTIRANKRSWPDFQFSKRGQSNRENSVSLRSRGSFGQGAHSDMDKDYAGPVPEIDELDVRDNLRCWNYSE
jgi:hypothetical protein